MIDNRVQNLLLKDNLSDAEIYQLLAPVGFADNQAAYRCLRRIPDYPASRNLMARSLPFLLQALSQVANPNQVLINFERFAQSAPSQSELFHHLNRNPRTVEILVTLFTSSQFLTEILLREPKYFERLTTHQDVTQPKETHQLYTEAQASLTGLLTNLHISANPALDALRKFHRWELLRIGAADLLGAYDLPTVTAQLSHLSDALVQACLRLVTLQTDTVADDFVVMAFGKLGGEELNYSSDIDLLFLCRDEPSRYNRLGQKLIDAISRNTPEGFLYRVDMRLRPWGRTGPLISTIEGYVKYLREHARLWEKQALLKVRPIAGNLGLGQNLIREIQPLLFDTPPDVVRREIHAVKQQIEAQLHQKGRSWGEVKLGEGSIRDIEFVTQYLQLAHGGKTSRVRSNNTLQALYALFQHNLLDPTAYRVLVDGYVFLRTVEHHLQLMHYRQTHQLPHDEAALDHLARRLGFRSRNVGQRFRQHYQQHSTVIRLVYRQQFLRLEPPPSADKADEAQDAPLSEAVVVDSVTSLLPHLVRMHPSYLSRFNETEIEHHAAMVRQLSETQPVVVETTPGADGQWQVTLVGYDEIGMLSLICGLMMVHGHNIVQGDVFSYGAAPQKPQQQPAPPRRKRRRPSNEGIPLDGDEPRKIVDVFVVQPSLPEVDWVAYTDDLITFTKQLRQGRQLEVQGAIAKRVAATLSNQPKGLDKLYPIDIEIDNDSAKRHTIVQIDAPDTIGFLYAFANALALLNINIRRVTVTTEGNWVRDVIYVTDLAHQKVKSTEQMHRLRVATVLIKQFTYLLPNAPNPEAALLHFRDFVGQFFRQPNWPDELASLERPEVMQRLARLLGVSDFLWDDFLRMQHQNLFPVLANVTSLTVRKAQADLRAELEAEFQQATNSTAREILNAFKDREMFRIDMRQIQGYIPEFGEFSAELTDLVEVVVNTAYHLALRELRAAYGLPRNNRRRVVPLAVCALGKCGGRELGFASDIELMFIYDGEGRTTGQRVISTVEFFNKLVFTINDLILAKRKGIFELDLRLRPYGQAGSMAVSLDSFASYFAPDGEAWPYERQALVRLRPIGGDSKLGQKILQLRDSHIYNGQPFDVAAMRAMRERQLRHSVVPGTVHAKLSPGALVDIEYLVQGLQITHGHRLSTLRSPSTAQAMAALAEANLLSPADHQTLQAAFDFLRRLINALRIVKGNAKELTVPPADSEAFAFLARRLAYERANIPQLQDDLLHHLTQVQEINRRLLAG